MSISRSLRQQSARLRLSDHAGIENVTRTSWHMENSGRHRLAMVPVRRRHAQLRCANGKLLQSSSRPEQPRRCPVDGLEQTGYRHSRNEQSRDDRSRGKSRLHSARELGRCTRQRPRERRQHGHHFLGRGGSPEPPATRVITAGDTRLRSTALLETFKIFHAES